MTRKNKFMYILCTCSLLIFAFLIGFAKPSVTPVAANPVTDSLYVKSIAPDSILKPAMLPVFTVTLPQIAVAPAANTASTATAVQSSVADRNMSPSELAAKRAELLNHNGSQVVSTARGMIGTRYRYGGSTSRGTDCSGLVIRTMSVALQKNDLPRTAAALYKQGISVNKADLMPGDLVFFSGTRGSRGGITHVGIYSGNNNFIHASSSKGVIETSLSTEYYAVRYRGARRVHSL